jgi:uncharacterized protein YndB with AHSA1/START domain
MKTRSIHQSLVLPGTPDQVYTALMTTKGHEGFTGAPAKVSGRVGGRFTAWGGYIHGSNLRLVRGRTIVQRWRPSESDWPKNYYSTIRFDLVASPRGTRVKFTQSFPSTPGISRTAGKSPTGLH